MSTELLKDWIYKYFVPNVENYLTSNKRPRKVILLLDIAQTHTNELQSGDINIRFLPANVTSLIQPMDQGIIEYLKDPKIAQKRH